MKRIALKLTAWVSVVLLVAVLGITVVVVDTFAPGKDEWSQRIRVGGETVGVHVAVSVPALIRAVTHPDFGPWLDGRILNTRYGTLQFGWRHSTQSLHVLCVPCVFRRPEVSQSAIQLEALELSIQRGDAHALRGAVFAGNVLATWRGTLGPRGLSVSADLPTTPLADLFALLADVVPEVRHAQIEGTASATGTLQLPHGTWSVAPRIEEFAVSGLGTEALANTARPMQCGRMPRKGARPSVWMERAVIAAEDQKFWQHPGYDLEEMLASLAVNQAASSIERGGSTITQQLAKLVFTGDDRTHARKLRELLFAAEMERTLGKARILQLYMALAPWGDGICGAGAAAQHYLHKQVSELGPVEAAWLAGMLRSPNYALVRLRSHGQIDVKRTQTVIEALRPAPRAKREQWAQQASIWLPASAPRAPDAAVAAPGNVAVAQETSVLSPLAVTSSSP
jgi:hypothetical protein